MSLEHPPEGAGATMTPGVTGAHMVDGGYNCSISLMLKTKSEYMLTSLSRKPHVSWSLQQNE
ncbi:hypothetical protein Pyn_18764 [Prunus yedoensis var. nudiflora]|uniref:Uncharacterized protein n=1 Tax=Prunus yedoensis var. nudiflora TaxID=2094558 RepID=A0A314YPP1_PRUYE|nr:hypothetical protein Pyn_18764 [Prunus yedoensis var. nudiflora]